MMRSSYSDLMGCDGLYVAASAQRAGQVTKHKVSGGITFVFTVTTDP